jgi:hypothetical protein
MARGRLRWEDELPPRRGKYNWTAIASRLRERPGTWLLIEEQGSRSIYSAVKRGRLTALRDPEWVYEIKTRNTNGNKADIWMSARPRTEEDGDAGCYRT